MIQKGRKISVVIPTFNSWKTLSECISSIRKQTLFPYEIIIIDNGSNDDTRGKVRKLTKLNRQIKYYRNSKNLGVTGGRNRGIKEADKKSDYIFWNS